MSDVSGYVILNSDGRINNATLTIPEGATNVHFRSSINSVGNITLKYYQKLSAGTHLLTGTYLLEPGEARDLNLNGQQFFKIEAVVPATAWLDYEYTS